MHCDAVSGNMIRMDDAIAELAQMIADDGAALVAGIADPATAESVQAFLDGALEALAAVLEPAPEEAPVADEVPADV